MRVQVSCLGINPSRYDTDTYANESPLDDMTAWRDSFRSRFTAESISTQMKASDIFTWTGSTNYTGYGFAVKDNTNNTLLIILTGGNHTLSPDIDDWLGGSGANLRTLVADVNDATVGSTTPQNGIVFLYNPDTTTSEPNLDFDDATELTYTGGDGTALSTIDPDSLAGLQALNPSHCVKGLSFEDFSTTDGWYMPFDFCYDDSRLVWNIVAPAGMDRGTWYIGMMGNAADPGASGGSSELVTFRATVTSGSSSAGAPSPISAYAFDSGGTERLYEVNPTNSILETNYQVVGGADDGKIDWKAVPIENGSGGSGNKGYFHDDMVVEIYPYDDSRYTFRVAERPDADNPVVKISDSFAIFWQANRPIPLSHTTGLHTQ